MKTEIQFLKYAAVLLGFCLLLASCKEDEVPETEPIQEELPVELRGTWIDQWSMTMQYVFDPLLYNPQSKEWFRGSYDPWSMDPRHASGIQMQEDGTFIWAVVIDAGNGGCQSYTAQYIKGTISVDGDELTFKPKVKRMKYHSVCEPGNVFDRDEALDSFTKEFSFSTETNYYGQVVRVITITDENGFNESYYQVPE